MLRFNHEDFISVSGNFSINKESARVAQEKLDEWIKENGKVVYGCRSQEEWHSSIQDERIYSVISSNFKNSHYKAILINIEPLEKCKHPREKVRLMDSAAYVGGDLIYGFMCECGSKVKPKEFEELK